MSRAPLNACAPTRAISRHARRPNARCRRATARRPRRTVDTQAKELGLTSNPELLQHIPTAAQVAARHIRVKARAEAVPTAADVQRAGELPIAELPREQPEVKQEQSAPPAASEPPNGGGADARC